MDSTARALWLAIGVAACGSGRQSQPPAKDAGPAGFQCQTIPDGGFPLDGGIVVTTVNYNLPWIGGSSLATDSQGDLYAADYGWEWLIELKASGVAAYIWADQPPVGYGPVKTPYGVAVAGDGGLIVTSYLSNQILRVDASGSPSVLAGTGDAGYLDGPADEAAFDFPTGVVVDDAGSVYVSDGYTRIRKIDPAGNVTTLAGGAAAGFADGRGAAAQFNGLLNLAISPQGLIYAADSSNNRIRVVDSVGNVTTLAGNGTPGYLDGPAASAEFWGPFGVALDSAGNVYVADTGNGRVRKIDLSGNVTTIAGNGAPCQADGTGGPNGTATLAGPADIAAMPNGDIYAAALSHPLQLIHFVQ